MSLFIALLGDLFVVGAHDLSRFTKEFSGQAANDTSEAFPTAATGAGSHYAEFRNPTTSTASDVNSPIKSNEHGLAAERIESFSN